MSLRRSEIGYHHCNAVSSRFDLGEVLMSMATVTSTTRICPADHGRLMTLEEFREAEVEDGYRYELARGVLEVTVVPDDDHGDVVCNLFRAIALFEQRYPRVIGRYGGGSEFRLWLPALISGRNPDVAVTLRQTPRDWRGRRPPSLAFEVVSEGSEAHERDYVTKRAEYLAFGLREYWIVDLQTRIVTVLVRDGDIWVEQIYRDDQQAVSVVLPGFTVRLPDLWPEVENEQLDTETTNGVS
jgi:Uma2 family endonuclease